MIGKTPYFAIGLPVFNGEAFIDTAIRSVIGQTFSDWRLTIVDNQSTDRTWPMLEEGYGRHPQITLVRNDRNLGMAGNLNRVLDLAEGEWFGILPADDAYLPHALETIHRETAQKDDLILWMHAHLVQGNGVVPNICPVYRERTRFNAGALAEQLYLRGNFFGEFSSYFMRLGAVHDPRIAFGRDRQGIDCEFWIRTLTNHPSSTAIYWPDVLTHVLQHAASGSSANTRSGASVADIFLFAGELSGLGWRRAVLLRQLLRLLRCWAKFLPVLPANARRLPSRALLQVTRALLVPGRF